MGYSTHSLTRADAPVYIPGYGNVPNGRVPAEVAAEQASRDQNNAWWAERNARNDKYRNFATAAVLGAGTLGAAAPALFGGAGAASAAAVPTVAGVGGSTLPAAASGMSIGKILGNPLTSLGVNTITSLLGMRSANNANRYQTDKNAEAVARQIALEEQRLASEASERQAQRVEDQRRWEAEEAYKAKTLAASEEERLYNRRLLEEREGRRAAYERQYREPALRNLRSILGF